MGIASVFTGNSTGVSPEDFKKQFGHLLLEGEDVGAAFKTIRDYYAFTPRRILIINAQGWSGKKKEITSIPLRSVTWFSVETGGWGLDDAEIKLHVRDSDPVVIETKKNVDVAWLQTVLAHYIAT